MTRSLVLLVLVGLVALSFAPQVSAFGAGNIPSYSHLEDRAFRHGDIEDIIEKCMCTAHDHVDRSELLTYRSVQGRRWWLPVERIQIQPSRCQKSLFR